ncbi:MAG TPA: nuclear transport factor 2 family protein [Terriglobales bacterium]|nr:nuclear transport factor 2 family protein [Terriglobales bacterium]
MKPTIGMSALGLTAVIVLLPGARTTAQTPATKPTSARPAIESVLKMQQEAWNRGDVDAFLQGYWHSPELTFSGSGGTSHGWDGVLQRYKKNYPDRASMGHLTFSGLEFHELGPRAYLVLGNWHLDRTSGDIGGVFTLVFQHFPGGWRIIHDHTSLVPLKH